MFNGISASQEQQRLQDATKSLFVDASVEMSKRNTNPFLVSASDETPKISPVLVNVYLIYSLAVHYTYSENLI